MKYNIYYVKSELNFFNIIPSFVQTDIKIPFGYTFTDHIWGNIYNSETNNKIGIIILNNYYVNTDTYTIGGNVHDDIVIFIENELPIGSINFLYNFYNNQNNTLIPPGDVLYPTIRALSGEYYGANITLELNIYDNEKQNIIIYM